MFLFMAQVNETYIDHATVTSCCRECAQVVALKILLGEPTYQRQFGNNHPMIESS